MSDFVSLTVNTHDEEGNATGQTEMRIARNELENVFNLACRMSIIASSPHSARNEDRLVDAVDKLNDAVYGACANAPVK